MYSLLEGRSKQVPMSLNRLETGIAMATIDSIRNWTARKKYEEKEN